MLTKIVSLVGMLALAGSAAAVPLAAATCEYTCGSNCYSSSAISAAVSKGYSLYQDDDTLGSDKYPHQYKDYEGFDFPTDGPWYEFPILSSGSVYAGGSPGADRVIFDSQGTFDSVITHTGASGDDFVACTQ